MTPKKKPTKNSSTNVLLSGEQTITCCRSPVKICGSSRTRFVLFPPTTLLADFVQKHFPSPAKGLREHEEADHMVLKFIWSRNPVFSQV